jgi:dTDP-4-dehydrorhamnose 3,5-epimerase
VEPSTCCAVSLPPEALTADQAVAAAIEGVTVVELRQIADERGAVYHMLRSTDTHFVDFGEIYFSSVYPRVVKAWKRHRRLTANYACIAGEIRLVLYDDRDASPSKGNVAEIVLAPTPEQYVLVVVPPHVWHGFQGLGAPLSILANCATEPHDPGELDRLDPHDERIPFAWATR